MVPEVGVVAPQLVDGLLLLLNLVPPFGLAPLGGLPVRLLPPQHLQLPLGQVEGPCGREKAPKAMATETAMGLDEAGS